MVTFLTHSGTHIDVPSHFFAHGKTVTDFDINDFVFSKPLLIDCPKNKNELVTLSDIEQVAEQLEQVDLLLFRTGFSRFRKSEIYRMENPGIHHDLADHLKRNCLHLRGIGIDAISFSPYQNRQMGRQTHMILLGESGLSKMILIEDLNLEGINKNPFRVFIVPLMLDGLDGSPATVFAETEHI